MNYALMLAAFAGLACAQSMDWETIRPAEAGLDPAKLELWRSGLAAHGTTGLIVIRRGRIVLEWYAPGWNADRPHGTASMAKALVGGVSLALAAARDPHLRPLRCRAGRDPARSASRVEGRFLEAQHQLIVATPSLDLIVVRNGGALADTTAGFWGPVYAFVVKPLMDAVAVRAPIRRAR